MLVELPFGAFPMALGVIYDDPAPTYEDAVLGQDILKGAGKAPISASCWPKGQTWTVAEDQGPLSGV